MSAGKMQEIDAQDRAKQHDETSQTPVDAHGIPMHSRDAGRQNGGCIQNRYQARDYIFGNRTASDLRHERGCSCGREGCSFFIARDCPRTARDVL